MCISKSEGLWIDSEPRTIDYVLCLVYPVSQFSLHVQAQPLTISIIKHSIYDLKSCLKFHKLFTDYYSCACFVYVTVCGHVATERRRTDNTRNYRGNIIIAVHHWCGSHLSTTLLLFIYVGSRSLKLITYLRQYNHCVEKFHENLLIENNLMKYPH